jgi:hypothetical protein
MGLNKDGVSDKQGLNEKQELAIDLVMVGLSDGEIAKRVGVSRKTINKWRNQDMDFRALLAERRVALRERHQDELSGLVSEAIGVMREAMREDETPTRLRAAQAVLRMSGLQAAMQTENPPTKEEILNEFLTEIIDNVARKQGFYGTEQLLNGEQEEKLGVNDAKRLPGGEQHATLTA